MSKKSEAAKQIPTEALERHFRLLIGQAVLWLGAERVLAIVECERQREAA